MSEIILKIDNLVKTFTNAKAIKLEVLKSISLEIMSGKVTLILGASGAGKSTLLHLIGGLDRPDSGIIFYENENILDYSEDQMCSFRNKNIVLYFNFIISCPSLLH